MTKTLDGKVGIVTGGSRGIGRAIATRLAADGARVVISYQSNHQAAKDVVNEIVAAGGAAASIDGDVADVAHLRDIYDFAASEFGSVDIVVNNAAITAAGPIATITEELFDRLVDVNLKSVVFSCQLAAERLSDHGRIVNISTVLPAAHVGILGAYGAAKGGIPVSHPRLGPRSRLARHHRQRSRAGPHRYRHAGARGAGAVERQPRRATAASHRPRG